MSFFSFLSPNPSIPLPVLLKIHDHLGQTGLGDLHLTLSTDQTSTVIYHGLPNKMKVHEHKEDLQKGGLLP